MEAERIITVVGAALGLPTDRNELMLMNDEEGRPQQRTLFTPIKVPADSANGC